MKRGELLVFGALLILTVARLVLGAFTELSPDEAYYLLWAQRLDWSYYSKGPGIALLLKLSTWLFGETQFGIRVFSPLLGFGTSFLAWQLGKRTVGNSAALWAVAAFNLTPIFNAGSIVMTIDPVLMFCWTAAMLTFWMALHEERPEAVIRWWLLTGLALGVGFLTKYTILVVFLTILVFLSLEKRNRAEFRRPGIWVTTALVLLATLPVVVWNAQNHWITVRHLLERTGVLLKEAPAVKAPSSGGGIRIDHVLEFTGMHFGVYSPLLFAGLLVAMARLLRRFRRSEPEFFLGLFSVPIIVFYFLLSLGDTGELNWTAPGFLGLGLLASRYWEELDWPASRKQSWAAWALSISLLLSLWTVNSDGLRHLGIHWPSYKLDPSLRLRGWESASVELTESVRALREKTGEAPFVIANKYGTAAELAFYAPDLEVIRPDKRYPSVTARFSERGRIVNQFAFWPSFLRPASRAEESLFRGKNAVYITDETRWDRVASDVEALFERCEMLRGFEVMRRGQPLRAWKIFACYGFKGSVGSEQRGN